MKNFKILLVASLLAISSFAFAQPININTADAETIAASMKGVGKARANAILAYRDKNGPFKSVDDLVMVKGVGEKTVLKNRAQLMVE